MLPFLPLILFFAAASAWTPQAKSASFKFRGVNLGSQFIIERWMAEDEWKSIGCAWTYDEWNCTKLLGQEKADAAFQKHWNSWISKDDIEEIASLGLNTVRIPVGFWMREDLVQKNEYYPRGGLKYLDRLVGWCKDAGIYVILDLHGGPGSQNPNEEFTGHSVSKPGFYTAANYERANKFLEWMANRIHTNGNYTTVGTLQVMNEPVHGGSWINEAADMVKNFYPTAYARIQAAETKLGVANSKRLHIQFMGKNWGSGDARQYLPTSSVNYTIFDDHRYYMFDKSVTTTKAGYITAACTDDRGKSNLVVGEWSLAVASEVKNSKQFNIQNRPDQLSWYRGYWAAQAETFERAGGWVFWSWKCNWMNEYDDWRWCYKSAVRAGVIPKNAGDAKKLSPCSQYV